MSPQTLISFWKCQFLHYPILQQKGPWLLFLYLRKDLKHFCSTNWKHGNFASWHFWRGLSFSLSVSFLFCKVGKQACAPIKLGAVGEIDAAPISTEQPASTHPAPISGVCSAWDVHHKVFVTCQSSNNSTPIPVYKCHPGREKSDRKVLYLPGPRACVEHRKNFTDIMGIP